MKFRKERAEPPAFDPSLTALSNAAHGEDAAMRLPPGKAVPELCEIAQRLAGDLYVYERRSGRDPVADVVVAGYGELYSESESDTRWPRPSGRWEIVLRRGDDVERVDRRGRWRMGGRKPCGVEGPGARRGTRARRRGWGARRCTAATEGVAGRCACRSERRNRRRCLGRHRRSSGRSVSARGGDRRHRQGARRSAGALACRSDGTARPPVLERRRVDALRVRRA